MKVSELVAQLLEVDQDLDVITDDSFDIVEVDIDRGTLYDRGDKDIVVLQCCEE